MGEEALMATIGHIVKRILSGKPSFVDSEVPRDCLIPTEADREQDIEKTLQNIAKNQFGTPIKAAVFKRIKKGRGQTLALVRMEHSNMQAPANPQHFIQQLVMSFNSHAEVSFQKHIDYAIWSDMEKSSTQVHSQFDVVQRAS